jgi:hypothetical protein
MTLQIKDIPIDQTAGYLDAIRTNIKFLKSEKLTQIASGLKMKHNNNFILQKQFANF